MLKARVIKNNPILFIKTKIFKYAYVTQDLIKINRGRTVFLKTGTIVFSVDQRLNLSVTLVCPELLIFFKYLYNLE